MDDQAPGATDWSYILLPWEQVEALADQFERDMDRTINRPQFRAHMLNAVMFYWLWRNGPFHLGTDEERADAKRASKAASKAAARFRLTLQRAFDAHLALPHGDTPADVLRGILNDLDGIEVILDGHLALFRRPTGRAPEPAWHHSVEQFGRAWWVATGQLPRAPYRRRTGDHGGKFVDWVASILDMIHPGHNRDALGNRIRGALRALQDLSLL